MPLALAAGPLYGSGMELEVGPFDPALHIRSRDHYEAVRREAQLLSLAPEAAPARLEDLIARLTRQFPPNPVDEVADRARWRALAAELGLEATGASDCHGALYGYRLGSERTPDAGVERLLSRAGAV